MDPVDISIVILTMDRPARCLTTARLAGMAARDLKAEILVVNNGREPFSLPQNLENAACRVLNMPKNLGAAARNEGWREARGRAVLMLDDDAAISPGLPEALLQKLDAANETGAVFFRVHDGKKEEGCLLPTVFHGCACGFRRETLELTGGYPKSFVYYGEEYDLTFRLYRAGLPPKICEDAPAVHHARDPGGRNKTRIIHFLLRNNAETWFAHFPLHQAFKALSDTIRWYRLVGIKERATAGFKTGCAAMPAAILRGLARRRPLTPNAFGAATLAAPVAIAAQEIRARHFSRVAICGVGKLPSLWLEILRKAGLTPVAFLDHNPAWSAQAIQRTPVLVKVNASWPMPDRTCALLLGTSSRPENIQWEKEAQAVGCSENLFSITPPK